MSEKETPEVSEAIVTLPRDGSRFQPRSRTLSRPSTRVLEGPVVDEQQFQALVERKTRFVENDPIMRVVDSQGDTLAVLREIKREIAREAASLNFERLDVERKGKDASSISVRRIEALRRVADIELKIREMDQHSINLSGEKMQKVYALWVEIMREIAQDVLSEEVMDLFFNRFATAMEGWEERAQEALR